MCPTIRLWLTFRSSISLVMLVQCSSAVMVVGVLLLCSSNSVLVHCSHVSFPLFRSLWHSHSQTPPPTVNSLAEVSSSSTTTTSTVSPSMMLVSNSSVRHHAQNSEHFYPAALTPVVPSDYHLHHYQTDSTPFHSPIYSPVPLNSLNDSVVPNAESSSTNATLEKRIDSFSTITALFHSLPSFGRKKVSTSVTPYNVSTYLDKTQSTVDFNTVEIAQGNNGELADEEPDEAPFEVLIRNDKTMAHLKFDQAGREVVKCALFDIEKDVNAVHKVPKLTGLKDPLVADYKTMLEAVRRCTALARKQHGLKEIGVIWSANQTQPSWNQSLASVGSVMADQSSGVTTSPTLTTTKPVQVPSTNASSSVHIASTGSIYTATSNGTSTGSSNSPNSAVSSTTTKTPMFDSNFISFWKGIVPGTKWCGLGDSASHYDDLGNKLDIDLCCRAHDHCPIRLKAFRMGYGLINFSFYSKSHCDCDEDFYRCLKQSTNSYAPVVGNFYFNVLKVHCIKNESPLVCVKKRKTATGVEECIEYGLTSEVKMKLVPFEYHF